ncbi:META domain-containing protein [Maritalea mobilis]|uniref:META domain-containing protein n=1 Tax=Maritalea mobilis TaxID=483324 RepID=UPI001C947EAC|nr:META domain-containing protein [Maritalea mobilis]MBY6201025.1 META domain-containing protein [Maritalea mobilis]
MAHALDAGEPVPRAAWRAACRPAVEVLERRFLGVLGNVSRYRGGLVLLDVQGHALLHFVEPSD